MIGHYLLFNRNCEEALKVYEAAFNGKIVEIQKYCDMPQNPSFPILESDKNLVLHARLSICGSEIMFADSSSHCTLGNNMYVSITNEDANLILKAWDILKEQGEIHMELAPTFFAKRHGSLQDKFGVNWMFTAMN